MLLTDRRVKTVALTSLGVTTKAELMERLYEPPTELLTLDRAGLEVLREALTKVRDSAQPAPDTSHHAESPSRDPALT